LVGFRLWLFAAGADGKGQHEDSEDQEQNAPLEVDVVTKGFFVDFRSVADCAENGEDGAVGGEEDADGEA